MFECYTCKLKTICNLYDDWYKCTMVPNPINTLTFTVYPDGGMSSTVVNVHYDDDTDTLIRLRRV